ncbi:MAG: hypothetical protein ACFFC7_03605 [Candidatus Hermodarchaeota archaeon]
MSYITFLGIRVVLDCYVGWKWKKLNLTQPELHDWVLVYIIFLGTSFIGFIILPIFTSWIWGTKYPYLFDLRFRYSGFFPFPPTIFSGSESNLLPLSIQSLIFYEVIFYNPMGIDTDTIYSLFSLFQIFTDLNGLIFSLFLPFILFYVGQRISEWENFLKRGKYVGLIYCGLLISSISGLFINTAISYPHQDGHSTLWRIDYGYPLAWLQFHSYYSGVGIYWLNFAINSIFWIITSFLVFFLVVYIINKRRNMR